MRCKKDIYKTEVLLTKLLVVCSFLLVTLGEITAQEKDVKSEYEKSFNEFKDSIEVEFETFKARNDSIFIRFLRQEWQEFELFTEKRVIQSRPTTQPVLSTEHIEVKEIKIEPSKTMMEDTAKQLQLYISPKVYNSMDAVPETPPYHVIDFYGADIKVPAPQRKLPQLSEVSNAGIAKYYLESSNNKEFETILFEVSTQATDKKLNGWGFLELLRSTSSNIYTQLNEQVLFTWYGLLANGYDAKIGYSSESVYLLASFNTPIYYKPYFDVSQKRYYLIPFEEQDESQSKIFSYNGSHPDADKLLALQINKLPELGEKEISRKITWEEKQVEVLYNENIIHFYQNYPDCDISLYFPPPLSMVALKSIDKIILPNIKGKTNLEKVNFLLLFVQEGIEYVIDDMQFGYENYMFAEEILYYPGADCEDRTVFLSQLVNHYIGLKTIGLVFPGHVTLAVNLSKDIEGTYVLHNNDKYFICDPTYIGSKCGLLMPKFNDIRPELIVF